MTATSHAARRHAPPSRLQLAHAMTFAIGLFGTLAGVLTGDPYFFVVAGPCLSISGALVLFGSRVAFRGQVGNTLRAVLGPARVRRLNMHALIWLLAGMLVSAWGVEGVRQRNVDHFLDDPSVGSNVR